jgi:phage shock protein C
MIIFLKRGNSVEKRLYRSQTNRLILGVCGGLAEYFAIDPVILRVIAVLIIIVTSIFPGLLAYFIMGLIIPIKGSSSATPRDNIKENMEDIRDTANKLSDDIRSTFSSQAGSTGSADPASPPRPVSSPSTMPPAEHSNGLLIVGIIVIAIGVGLLLLNALSWVFRYLWPSILILAGVLIIIAVVGRKSR